MKKRIFKKCVHHVGAYRHYPKYTRKIICNWDGRGMIFWYDRMRWQNGKFELKDHKVYC